MSEGLLLGIDLGTSSSKGVLCRPGGEVVATAERPHEVSMPHPGWVEHRAAEEVEELTGRYGNEEIVERCGNPLTSQSVGPKIAWVRRNEPEVWENTAHFFMSHTFVVYRLTGAYVLDHPAAGMCEPLYDHRERRWIGDWAEEVAPGLKMP